MISGMKNHNFHTYKECCMNIGLHLLIFLVLFSPAEARQKNAKNKPSAYTTHHGNKHYDGTVHFTQIKRRYPRKYAVKYNVPRIENDDFGFAPYVIKQKHIVQCKAG